MCTQAFIMVVSTPQCAALYGSDLFMHALEHHPTHFLQDKELVITWNLIPYHFYRSYIQVHNKFHYSPFLLGLHKNDYEYDVHMLMKSTVLC